MRRSLRSRRTPRLPGAAALLDGHVLPVRRWPERRAVVLSAAVVLFVGVFVLRMTTGEVESGVGLLFVIPTALVALELGLVAGLAAAGLATALIVVWWTTRGVDLGLVGLATRALVFFAVGTLSGRFSDRMREAAVRQRGLLDSGLALAHLGDARELPATAATRIRSAVAAAGTRVTLVGYGGAVDGVVGPEPIVLPIEMRGVTLGEAQIEPARPLVPEDEATLATLALQIAIASENQRLLTAERERAVLDVQLKDARERLDARGDQLREVLLDQEDERRDVSRHLHEDSAQAVAAILLGLGAVERSLDSDAARPQLAALREHAEATLAGLRDLAVTLRPPVLDLSLAEALTRLGERRDGGDLDLSVALDGAASRVTPELETAIYRIVEECLEAFDAPRRAAVRQQDGGLLITVAGEAGARPRPERVTTIGARVGILGGTVEHNGELRVHLPLGAP
jgi:signal transduction histidine kinase